MTFNRHYAAVVLADAAFFGDQRAAERNNCTKRTVQHYRARLRSDPALVALFAEKRAALTDRWADGLAPAIVSCLDFIQRAASVGDLRDPEMLRSVNGSLKIVADVATQERVLDARFPRAARPPGPPTDPMGSVPDPSGAGPH